MPVLVRFIFVMVLYLLFSLISGYVGWALLDEFGLDFGTWFNIAFVAIGIVRAGLMIEDLAKDLTK